MGKANDFLPENTNELNSWATTLDSADKDGAFPLRIAKEALTLTRSLIPPWSTELSCILIAGSKTRCGLTR